MSSCALNFYYDILLRNPYNVNEIIKNHTESIIGFFRPVTATQTGGYTQHVSFIMRCWIVNL